jgi:putative oxidoreductase
MPVKTETIWGDRAAKAVLLIRILAGWVFPFEAIQKFFFPDSLGGGRIVKIGIP